MKGKSIMILNFGTFSNAVKVYAKAEVNNKNIVSTLVGTVDKENKYNSTNSNSQVSKLFNCTANFPTIDRHKNYQSVMDGSMTTIMQNLPNKITTDFAEAFSKEVLKLIDPDRESMLLAMLLDIVDKDKSLREFHPELFRRYTGYFPTELKKTEEYSIEWILSGLFLYSVATGNNADPESISTIKAIKDLGYQMHISGVAKMIKLIPFIIFCKKRSFVIASVDIAGIDETSGSAVKSECMPEITAPNYMLPLPNFIDKYRKYLTSLFDKYSNVKTMLYSSSPHPFSECYICNDVTFVASDPQRVSTLVDYYKSLENGQPYTKIKDIENLKIGFSIRIKNITPSIIGMVSRFVIITGTGGIGKSMMMRNLLLTAINDMDKGGYIPLYVSLKDFCKNYKNFYSYLYKKNKAILSVKSSEFKNHLKQGGFLILMDGLDEIPANEMIHFDTCVDSFIDEYPLNQYVISSRPYSNFVSYTRFTVIYLEPFDREQSIAMIEKIQFREDTPDVKSNFIKRLNSDLFDTHYEFASNPLLLTIMLMTFGHYANIASKMHIFYKDAYEALAWKHDANKGAYERKFETGLDKETFSLYLEEFCARTYMDEKYEFTRDEFEEYYRKLIIRKKEKNVTSTAQAFINDLCKHLCIIYEENQTYHFIHRSFQEYFCASYFSKDSSNDQLWKMAKIFDDLRRKRGSDSTFAMLYDMIPQRIESAVFFPYLGELLNKCSQKYDYYSFIMELYPQQSYRFGNMLHHEMQSLNLPLKFMYRFIAHEKEFLHSYEEEKKYVETVTLPYIDDYIVEGYIGSDEAKILMELANEEDIYHSDDSIFDDNKMMYIDSIVLDRCRAEGNFPVLIGGRVVYYMEDVIAIDENVQEYTIMPEFAEFYNNPQNPLLLEYNGAKRYYNELKRKIEDSIESTNLFD